MVSAVPAIPAPAVIQAREACAPRSGLPSGSGSGPKLAGPAHIWLYAHAECVSGLKRQIAKRGEVFDQDETREIPPSELIRHYPDITDCDHCGQALSDGSKMCVALMVMGPEELELWRKIRHEDAGGDRV